METNAFGAFIEMWARAFDFSGRTRRATYWEAFLITIAISLLLGAFFPYADVIFTVLAAIPMLSMAVRRMHDIDKRGWWLLLSLIPLGGIAVSVLLLMDSDGANRSATARNTERCRSDRQNVRKKDRNRCKKFSRRLASGKKRWYTNKSSM